MRPNTNVTNLEATANTSPESASTQATPNETAALIGAYGEISDSFSSLMKRLKEINYAGFAQGSSSLSTENRIFLACVGKSLMDTMNKRLNIVADNLKEKRMKGTGYRAV